MPTNITQGNTAQFVVQPLSSLGLLTIPSSVTLTVTYNISGVVTSTSVSLVLSNSFWTGTWNSTPADLGLASWAVSFPGVTGTAASGTLNIIDP